MTASLRLNGRVDLERLLMEIPMFAGRTKGFSAISLILLTKESATVTALIYSSGSVVFVGGKSVEQLQRATRELMEKTMLSTSTPLKVHNIVCSMKIHTLNLTELFMQLRNSALVCGLFFEPELFPALSMKVTGTNRKFCVFASGTINMVGSKSLEEADAMRALFFRILNET